MQTSIASRVHHLRLRHLIAAAVATVTLAGTAAASPTTAPASSYRIVPLAPDGHFVSINAKGQVAYTTDEGGISRARFYDGAVVRDLGTFGGPSAAAFALNDHGQVVGTASTSDGAFHAFRWSRQTGLVDLNPPGVAASGAVDINNKGQVAGNAVFSSTTTAFRWSAHTGMVNLGSLGPSLASVAFAINDAGTVVGYSEVSPTSLATKAVMWPPGSGGPIPLTNFPSDLSIANDINNAGQIVGSAALDASGDDQAFIWTRRGGLQGVGTESAYLSFATRINEKGLVIGNVRITPDDNRGFIWSRENGLLTIGTPQVDQSLVIDVNNRGQAVGSLNDRAFIWTRAGGVVDLNSLVTGAPPEFHLYLAEAISDNGTIVARSTAAAAGLVLLVPNSAYHQPPVAGAVKLTGAARVNALLSFSASFKDVDVRDTHKAVWSWGDGSKTVGTVSERQGTGSVSAQHAYRAAGIYTVRLTITDSSGKSSTVERKVVVVCGCAAATTGVGAFASPANAAASGPRRASVGTFAFLAEGTDARRAAVEVNVAGMVLRSIRIEKVALDGARVQYSGQGTVNGRGNYRFTLTATSGAKNRIHVRIAHTEPGSKAEVVDYDNGVSAQAKGAAPKAAAADAEGSVVIGEGNFEFGAR